ncbi:MAG: class I SAM-dependent methyltransferase [Dehalococcoidales bacterium]|nr:class I SAM-dependent methyltransferase [Dehalococcoidales bacterium]
MDRTREFFNARADRWDETSTEQDTRKLEAMADRLELKPGSIVLDVGTGTGTFLRHLLKRIGQNGRITALDVAEKMLVKAMEKYPGANIDYLHADIMDIPVEFEKFDTVVCYSTFPHFEDKPLALKEIYRVMKSGGRVFVCHTSSRAHINEIHNSIPAVHGHTLPDCHEMEKLLSDAGFISIRVEEDDESYFACGVKP